MRFYPLEKLINLQDGYTRVFKIDSHQLLLLQREGEIHLIESHCPHREHPLDVASIAEGVAQDAPTATTKALAKKSFSIETIIFEGGEPQRFQHQLVGAFKSMTQLGNWVVGLTAEVLDDPSLV